MPIVLSLFVFCFSLLSFFFPLFFFVFFLLRDTLCFFNPLFWARQGSSYNAYRDRILPFCPLTAFVWSRRTCLPPKGSSVCHSPLPDKGRFVSFISPLWHPFYHGVSAFSLYPSWHAPNSSSLNLASFGQSIIPTRCTP